MTDGAGDIIRVLLLGRFEVQLSGAAVIDRSWPRRKAAALLKLIAVQPGRSLHRDQITEHLWPDMPPEAAANNLRQNLHYLRKALAEQGAATDLVRLQGDIVVLSRDVLLDVDEFRAAAAAARESKNEPLYEQALAIYGGDLLPDDLYEEWAMPQREELLELRHRLLVDLSGLYEQNTHVERGVERLQQLLRGDATSEEAHRGLMRIYARTGRRDRALRQYELLRETLRRELDVEPSQETEALHRSIAYGRTDEGAGPALSPPLSVAISERGAGPVPVPSAQERRSRARPWLRIAVAAVLLAGVGGGSAAGLALSGAVGGSGASSASAYRELDYHLGNDASSTHAVSGDCKSSDLVLKGSGSNDVSGEMSGHTTYSTESVMYAGDGCRWGYNRGAFTVTDVAGNTLSGVAEVVVSIVSPTGEGLIVADPAPGPFIYTGGTGMYEGATGHGRCVGPGVYSTHGGSATTVPQSVEAASTSDCTSQWVGGAAAADLEPVILELGAGEVTMTVFTGAVDLPKKAYFNVLYFNPHDQPQQGLSLKLRLPGGAEVLLAARGEEEPATAGERVWALPDLGPREVGSFQFSVEILSATAKTIPLVAEIDGDGFKQPVHSSPLVIEVVQ